MHRIPCITSDSALMERLNALTKGRDTFGAEVQQLATPADALECLNVELPELVFINFSDPAIDGFKLLEAILEDPWLHFASIIALCGDYDINDRLEQMRGANIVVSLVEDELERYLPKILDIIANNRRILFQRGIGANLMQHLSGAYEIANDTLEANCYANLLCNYLYNTNRIDADGRRGVNVALTEMLINGIEHGNCGITYEEKSAWLEEGNMMRDLIGRKCADPAVARKRVTFEYTISPASSTFVVTDQGPGFDWRGIEEAKSAENVMKLHGRGIKMTRRYTKNLRYNAKGNQVTFEIAHGADCAPIVPAIFEHAAPVPIKAGDVVFREGESGDHLYYIVKGRFEVLVGSKVVSTLTADDLLMGEMSFLLNHRRSATVRATTDGTLIPMSKKEYVQAIREKPHYGLFLSRLLAQRLRRRNQDLAAD